MYIISSNGKRYCNIFLHIVTISGIYASFSFLVYNCLEVEYCSSKVDRFNVNKFNVSSLKKQSTKMNGTQIGK